MSGPSLGLEFLSSLIDVLGGALTLVIAIHVIRTWVSFRLPFGLDELVGTVSEAVLRPIRRIVPYMGGMDFSPFIALVAISIAERLLHSLLPR